MRLALGAPRRQVLALVLRQGLALVLAGGATGLVGALALAGVLRSQLYEVHPADPAALAAAVLLLGAVASVATLVPARRAPRRDPAVALRDE